MIGKEVFVHLVHGRGPMNAEIVVIGESPGRREDAAGLPFIGPSGKLQDQWIIGASLDPAKIRFDNVYPFFPSQGDINNVPWGELQQWQDDLLVRLDELPGLRVIVPTGNVALGTLLDINPWTAKITQRRGSIYLWRQASGRRVKVIPVIHPAAVLREEGERYEENGRQQKKSYEFRCRQDWYKIAQEVKTGLEDIPPKRELVSQPTEDYILHWIHSTNADARLAFDIENNPKTGKILCISFACEATRAISLPWSSWYKEFARRLLANAQPKITQYGQHDCYLLAREGITVNNWQHDTMAKSCLLWPNEPHSLAYLASILTREPWYKGTDEDTGEKVWNNVRGEEDGDRWRELLQYNARDAAVTWECDVELDKRLVTKGWMAVYEREQQALLAPILDVMLHGIAADREELQRAFVAKIEAAQQALQRAQEAAGTQLFTFDTQVQEACWRVAHGEWDRADPAVAKKLKRAKGGEAAYAAAVETKGVSNQILASVLYTEMKLPVQRMRRTKAITTNEAALLKLRARFKDSGTHAAGMALIEGVLQYREQKRQSECLDPRRLDDDERFRASYSFRPTTGRLSSSANPKGTGGNAQNIDRDLRHPFKPDPGCLLLEVDLSQAEARVVYCLTGNKKLIEIAHTRPNKFDVHRYLATIFFEMPLEQITRDQRTPTKNIGHGSHYDLHINKLSEMMLKQNYNYSPKQCGVMQGKYWDFTEGAIQEWQQRTRMDVLRDRALTNAWGRTIEFPYERFSDELYRRAYAWRPQSDIARHLNKGWIEFAAWLKEHAWQSRVNLQLHDALIVSVYPEEAYYCMTALVDILEKPHMYYGERLSIPAEIKLGTAWGLGDIGEWKQLPERERVEECVQTWKNTYGSV
jgi:uracil-DNA glycosylase family 4